MKNFLTFGIVDEAHTCKGGASAQGISFQHLLNACEKPEPHGDDNRRNRSRYLLPVLAALPAHDVGDTAGTMERFSGRLRVVEKRFELIGDAEHWNVGSRGRQIGSLSVKPGISPRLFLKLVDKGDIPGHHGFFSHLPDFPARR